MVERPGRIVSLAPNAPPDLELLNRQLDWKPPPGQSPKRLSVSVRTSPPVFACSRSLVDGLRPLGNPILSNDSEKLTQQMLRMWTLRNTNWRAEFRLCPSQTQRHAAHLQRVGIGLPAAHSCLNCSAGNSPFETCCVGGTEGRVFAQGACGNCAFSAQGNKCSLKESRPEAYLEIVRNINPAHELLSQSNVPIRSETT